MSSGLTIQQLEIITSLKPIETITSEGDDGYFKANMPILAKQLLAVMQENAKLRNVLADCHGYILEVGQSNGEWEKELLQSIDEALSREARDE